MVKALYSSNSVCNNKHSNNSSLFGDLEQSRYGKNIIYECGFTLMRRQDQHSI